MRSFLLVLALGATAHAQPDTYAPPAPCADGSGDQNSCAARESALDAPVRNRKLAAISAHWPPAQQQAFRNLQTALSIFLGKHARELDQGGTGSYGMTITEMDRYNDDFLAAIIRFEHHDLPSYAPQYFAIADAALNAMYRTQLRSSAENAAQHTQGLPTPEDLQVAQRAWLRYRDAWVAFAALRYPSIPADSFRTWLTLDRTDALQTIN